MLYRNLFIILLLLIVPIYSINFTSNIINYSVNAYKIKCIDLDSDGDNDIIINPDYSASIRWLENDGNGFFLSNTNILNVSNELHDINVSDFNNDSKIDILINRKVLNNNDNIEIFWNSDDKYFSSISRVSLSDYSLNNFFAFPVDIDKDNDIDIVSTTYNDYNNTRNVVWYENNGDSTFTEKIIGKYNYKAIGLLANDMNNDSLIDVVLATEQRVFIYYNQGNSTYLIDTLFTQFMNNAFMEIGDLDNNGFKDIILPRGAGAGNIEDSIEIMFQTDSMEFWSHNRFSGHLDEIKTADIDNDNDIDVIGILNHSQDKKLILLNNDGSGNFSRTFISGKYHTTSNKNSIDIADIDNDGDWDIVANCESQLVWYENSYSPNIVGPNGGEVLITDSIHSIELHAGAIYDSIKLEYSIDNGVSWNSISSFYSINNYEWQAPNVLSDSCLIRLLNKDGSFEYDRSDSCFSIVHANLKVINPNVGDEVWIGGSLQEITWNSNGDVGLVTIECSIDSGNSWQLIGEHIENTGNYIWEVFNLKSKLCIIKITSENYPEYYDISNKVFEIQETPILTFLSPLSEDKWNYGTVHEIRWNSVNVSDTVKLEYSYTNGATWEILENKIYNVGSYLWNIPITYSDSCLIRITDISKPEYSFICNSFSIIYPELEITYPNGGEYLVEYDRIDITWNTIGIVPRVKLEYSVNETDWEEIRTNLTNLNSFNWVIPANAKSKSCKIRISEISLGISSDVSDSSFIVDDQPKVFILNNQYSLNADDTTKINWRTLGKVDSVIIEVTIDNEQSWDTINNQYQYENDTGGVLWIVPDTIINGNDCKVKVTELSRFSNAISSHQIIKNPYLKLLTPIGGEIFKFNNVATINWDKRSIDSIQIYYSIDNKNSWTLIDTVSASDMNYAWVVPNVESENSFIKISDINGFESQNNLAFTISYDKYIQLLTPNGGEEFSIGSVNDILWNSYDIDFVNIEVSLDAGTTWEIIDTNISNNNHYAWHIPDEFNNSGDCLLKIRDKSNSLMLDTSDNTFKIDYSTSIDGTVGKSLNDQLMAAPNPVSRKFKNVLIQIPQKIDGNGSIVILDNLGNLIDEQVLSYGNKRIYKWDLTNRFGNKVGNGVYLILLSVKLNDGTIKKFKVPLGVKN